ncbi:MAG: ABC transporter substrate-binding protein [Deltaproteobacteria bacterium]|nr:ABC transporter substrate-binding protein [Deltaproteobacteria bacterium]
MIRDVILAVLLISLVALAGACSGGPRPGQDPSGRTTIVFRHGKIPGDPEPFQALLRRFEAEHPDLRIVDELLPAGTDREHQWYVTNLEGRSVDFDVLAMDVIWVQEFARAGWLRELGEFLSRGDQDAFLPGPIAANTFRGGLYGVPWFADAGLLYYRQDLLERHGIPVPATWEALQAAVARIRAAERNPDLHGFLWQGRQSEGLVCVVLEVAGSLPEPGQPFSGPFEDPRLIPALRLLRGFIAEGVSPGLVLTADAEAARRSFGAGRAIFMRNWPYAWRLLQGPRSPVRGKVGIAPLPHFPRGRSASVLGGWQLGITRASRHPREAWRFVAFMTGAEAQRHLARSYALNPTRVALYRDEALRQEQPVMRTLFPILNEARPRPVTPFYMMATQILQGEFSAAIAALRPPEEAAAEVRRQTRRLLTVEFAEARGEARAPRR